MNFLRESRLFDWVVDMNMRHGVAPPLTWTHRQKEDSLVSLSAEDSAWETPTGNGNAYRWLRGFRKRWKLSLAACPARENLSLDAQRMKANDFRIM